MVRPSSPHGPCRTRLAFVRMAAPRGAEGEAWWTGLPGLTINRRSRPRSRVCGNAQVAQLVEHATENRSVGGSIPPLGTIPPNEFKTISDLSFRLILRASIRGVILGNRRKALE
jgi:hypothetical protein